jgi:release factor glutamine methyltransferase
MREQIQQATLQLEEAGVTSAAFNARSIWAHAMGMKPWELSLRNPMPSPQQEARALHLLEQRAKRIPLQHLIGSVGFSGLNIRVSPDVLIPRDETELLVEKTCQQIRVCHSPTASILDMATGSGCIALALAAALPHASVDGVDISPQALAIAQQNASDNGLSDRVTWTQSDLWKAFEGTGKQWEIMVSNPPYIPSQEIDDLEPEVKDHDPRLALDGGSDGLDYYRRLALEAPPYLAPEGSLLLECGMGQAQAIKELFISASWFAIEIVQDYCHVDRFVVLRRAAGSHTGNHS